MSSGWLGLDWGTVPAWTGSILTSGSILVASIAYRRSVHDKEAEQASKVYAWIDEAKPSENGEGRVLRIRNSSDSLVYALSALPFGAERVELAELPQTSEYHLPLASVDSGLLRRTYSLRYPALFLRLTSSVELQNSEPSPLLQFRDSGGRWWERDAKGNLRRERQGTVLTKSTFIISFFGIKISEIVFDYGRHEIRIAGRRGE